MYEGIILMMIFLEGKVEINCVGICGVEYIVRIKGVDRGWVVVRVKLGEGGGD